jgi:dTDP-4-dehydrorhamnose reductase
MTNILVTGSNGQLGNEIRCLANSCPDFKFLFTDVAELDITKPSDLSKYFNQNKIGYIINCAAFTAVDKAESNLELANLLNTKSVGYLVEQANQHGAKLIHVSTDYVFDGNHYLPYKEDDAVNPLSVYGKTKLNGEFEALKAKNSIIIRTSWLYSSFGNNFVKNMIKNGQERDSMNVVYDQLGGPTYAADLALAILTIIKQSASDAAPFKTGIYHYANEGVTSWYDFTKAIHQLANVQCKLNPIETKDYPLPATRPFYSVFNKTKIKTTFQLEIPYWKDSLEVCIKKINQGK